MTRASRPLPRLLLVTISDPAAPTGGREMLYRLNRRIFQDLLGDCLSVYTPPPARRPGLGALATGHIDGIDRTAIAAIDRLIARERIDTVFLDGSNLGAAARAIKARHPAVRVITFFHNVEARFFWGALRARPRPKALAVLLANYLAERAAVRESDVLVCLSARDGEGLARLYGRGADAIAPMALADQDRAADAPRPADIAPGYALFVGGGFYANLDGARWFCGSVSPRLTRPTVLVGRGIEALTGEVQDRPKVHVVGEVDDLAPWYRDAAMVVAPIFDGSGMKTKVAEALMHGKHVVGSPEAFSGYSGEVVEAGALCRTADEFTAAVAASLAAQPPRFDPAMRALYEANYSLGAATARMAAIIGVEQASPDEAPKSDRRDDRG